MAVYKRGDYAGPALYQVHFKDPSHTTTANGTATLPSLIFSAIIDQQLFGVCFIGSSKSALNRYFEQGAVSAFYGSEDWLCTTRTIAN